MPCRRSQWHRGPLTRRRRVPEHAFRAAPTEASPPNGGAPTQGLVAGPAELPAPGGIFVRLKGAQTWLTEPFLAQRCLIWVRDKGFCCFCGASGEGRQETRR